MVNLVLIAKMDTQEIYVCQSMNANFIRVPSSKVHRILGPTLGLIGVAAIMTWAVLFSYHLEIPNMAFTIGNYILCHIVRVTKGKKLLIPISY